MDFEEHQATMNQEADDRLGDVIEVQLSAGASWIPRKGFVLEDDPGFDEDRLNKKRRVKIRKTFIPNPTRAVRLRAAKLGAGVTFTISGDPQSDSDYWQLSVERA